MAVTTPPAEGGIPDYADEDCTIYLYVNNERVAYEYSKTLTYKYKQLLRVTLRCDATCKNIRFGDTVVSSSELTINTYEFIGLCAGAGVLVILLVIALFCGARHCKRTYYTKLEDQEEAADAPPRRQARSPEPTAPSLPPRVEIEMETPPAKHFSDSSESDSDNEDVDTQRRALYNLNYNYPEKASDI